MIKYFVVNIVEDGESFIVFSRDDINSKIPAGSIEITEVAYLNALEINANSFVGGVLTHVTPPLTPEQVASEAKRFGVLIQGEQISLNESNQNGLAAMSTMIDKSVSLGGNPFPMFPSLETASGVARLVANNQTEFDNIFVAFGTARQAFFT